jgi:hypothetical protein
MTQVKKTTGKSCAYWQSLRLYLIFFRTFSCLPEQILGLWVQHTNALTVPEGFIGGIRGEIERIPRKGRWVAVLKVTERVHGQACAQACQLRSVTVM